jgi:two-component system nitrogen regulation response regulator NtrX
LYYRLNVLPVTVPPLRARRDDIPLLIRHFMQSHAEEQGLKIKQLTPSAMEQLQQYDWPGNIRELRNLTERLMIMVPGTQIDDAHVAAALQVRPAVPSATQAAAQPALVLKEYDSLRDARNAFEKEYITRKLKENRWNVSRTADELRIERSHLHRKIKLLSIDLRPES